MSFSAEGTTKLVVIDGDGDGGAPILPDELIRNILKRLPVKSLIRFQCVCKHWKNLFKTPSFIADHLHHSTHQNPSLLVLQSRPLHLCLLNCEMQVREIEEARLIDSLGSARLFARVVGSTNGLLCVEINKHDDNPYSHPFLLWNPAIREARWVPRTNTQVQCHFFVGFGFNPVDDDLKIVMIYSPKSNVKMNQVKVFSLSSGSWNEVECGILEGIIVKSEPVTANGEMFWLGSRQGVEDGDNDGGYDVIISFDMAMEVFSIMPTPDLGSISSCRLAVYESKLAMLSSPAGQGFRSSLIHLWVMDEGTYAAKERWGWVKNYVGDPFLLARRPVIIWRNEVVCDGSVRSLIPETRHVEFEERKEIALCNITTHHRKLVDIGYRCEHIFNYAESLVPVGGMKSFAVSM